MTYRPADGPTNQPRDKLADGHEGSFGSYSLNEILLLQLDVSIISYLTHFCYSCNIQQLFFFIPIKFRYQCFVRNEHESAQSTAELKLGGRFDPPEFIKTFQTQVKEETCDAKRDRRSI